MRALIFFIWLIIYTLGMWTESVVLLVRELSISLNFQRGASWDGFWSLSYLSDLRTSRLLFLQKLSHYVSSIVLALLFFSWMGLRLSAVAVLLLGVTFIEIFQAYFGRESLALDVFLNAFGVMTGAVLLWLWYNVLEKEIRREEFR